jgi:hypothetical protein
MRLEAKNYARRVILMNGAEHVSIARKTALLSPNVEFFNLVCESDNVLSIFGSTFSPELGRFDCIGQKGIGRDAPDNWTDIYLDDPIVRRWGYHQGWNLRGDNPDGYMDHWHIANHPGNHGLLRAILDYKEINPPSPNGQ